MPVAKKESGALGVYAVAIGCFVSGLALLIVPHVDDPQFTPLTHLSGKIDAVRRLSAPGSMNPAVSMVLSNADGQHTVLIQSYKAHPARLAGLSLGALVDAWVDHDSTGAMFAWQIERDGEVLVGYKDRLESSWRLQQRLSFAGWPLLGVGILLILFTRWRMRGSRFGR